MNYSEDTGWYYISPDSRYAAWSGVDFFYNFAISNKGAGFFDRLGGIEEMAVEDIIQLDNSENRYYLTLFVCGFIPRDILVAAYSFDAYMHPLSSYHYSVIRCIKFWAAENPYKIIIFNIKILLFKILKPQSLPQKINYIAQFNFSRKYLEDSPNRPLVKLKSINPLKK